MADDGDDYEALPSSTSIQTHMVAGAAAGVMEHCIVYPVDCVKTRMQSLAPEPNANYRNVADAFYRIVRHEGLGRTLRGIDAMILGAGPAHAMYFACYEQLKFMLSRSGKGNHIAHGTAGAVATVLHDAVMTPSDVVKQRMQMYDSPYRTCRECVVGVYRTEGVKAFYRSYFTQLSMNIPFQSLHFMLYEVCQDALNKDRQYSPKSHMVSGAVAGAVAAACTTPLDVCKTLLNTQERCAVSKLPESAINGMFHAGRTIYQFKGIPGFFRGITARVIYQMPATAISWSVYEFFKYFLTQQKEHEGLVSTPNISRTPNVQAVSEEI